MALGEKSFFWDKPAGTLTEDELAYYQYAAQDLASFFECLYTTGIAPQMAITSPDDNPEDYIGSSLAVTAGSGLQVVVSPGVAMIKGRGYIASLPVTLQVAAGKTTDIVLRMDLGSEKPEIYVAAKQRAANASLESNISHESLNYEVALATIVIPSDSTAITQPMITDQRLNTTVHPTDGKPIAGLMKSIPNADTKGIWEDYQSLQSFISNSWDNFIGSSTKEWNTYLSSKRVEFENWFNTLEIVLSGDVAANLTNKITNHTQNTGIHVTAADKTNWNNKANKWLQVDVRIPVNAWINSGVGNGGPWRTSLDVPGITTTNVSYFIVADSATETERTQSVANLSVIYQEKDRVVVNAQRGKPTIDIPLTFYIKGED